MFPTNPISVNRQDLIFQKSQLGLYKVSNKSDFSQSASDLVQADLKEVSSVSNKSDFSQSARPPSETEN